MAKSTIASMAVILSANTAKFQKGMGKALKTTDTFGAKFRVIAKRVAIGFAAITAAATAMATVVAVKLIALTKAGFKSVDALAKTASKLGISTEALAAFRLAAEKAGVNVKTFDMALQRMARRVAEAAIGTGEAQGAIKELGLDARTLSKLALDKQLEAVAEAFQRIPGSADRVRLAFKLFDSEGVALKNLLDEGVKSFDKAREESERFGTALSAIDARKVEMANDAMTNIRQATKGLGEQLAVRVAPFVLKIAEWLSDISNVSNTVTGIWTGLAIAAQAIADAWRGILIAIKAVQVAGQSARLGGHLLAKKLTLAGFGTGFEPEGITQSLDALVKAGAELDEALANRIDVPALIAAANAEAAGRAAASMPSSDIPSFDLPQIAARIEKSVVVIRETVQRQATNTAALVHNAQLSAGRTMIGAIP